MSETNCQNCRWWDLPLWRRKWGRCLYVNRGIQKGTAYTHGETLWTKGEHHCKGFEEKLLGEKSARDPDIGQSACARPAGACPFADRCFISRPTVSTDGQRINGCVPFPLPSQWERARVRAPAYYHGKKVSQDA